MEIEKQYPGPPHQTPMPQRKQNHAPKIRVCIRKRPLNNKERMKNEKDIVDVRNGREVYVKEKKVGYTPFNKTMISTTMSPLLI